MSESIKVLHGALDEDGQDIVLRGVLDPDTLRFLQIAKYQREILPVTTLKDLIDAFEAGDSIPDLDLGMRGDRVREVGEDGTFFLLDPVYIVDGLQRVSAAQIVMERGKSKPRLGATVHFQTTEKWERERFHTLNAKRTKLSPNVLLRNFRHDIAAIDVLYRLVQDKNFILHDKVSWDQRMKRQDLITALTFAKVAGTLHGHIGPGQGSRVAELSKGLQKIMDVTGPNVFRENVRAFFGAVDQCWGIPRITYKEGAVYMRSTFLWCLASIFSRHLDFWRGDRLFVEASLTRKIALFNTADPQVTSLSSASGKAREVLYILMINHINSGKRTRKLRPRGGVEPIIELPEAEEEPDEAESAAE